MRETKSFSSLEEFITAACGHSEMRWESRSSRATGGYRKEFTGTDNFEQALAIARDGWPEGVEKIKSVATAISERIQGSITERQVAQWDVSGADVDIGRYVTSDPECMIDFVPDLVNAPAKFLRLIINISCSAGITADQITNKGAAVVALVDALESQGYRVEIDASDARGDGSIYESIIRLKNAGEPLEIDRLAFSMAHPAMFRRLCFSYCETLSATWRRALGVPGGYGRVQNSELEADIKVTALRLNDESQSVQWVLEQLRPLGIQFETAAQ